MGISIGPNRSGATVVPNVNVRNRRLARPISTAIFSEQLVLDAAREPAFPGDPQLLPLSLKRQDNQTDGEMAILAVSSPHHVLFDAQGKKVKPEFEVAGAPFYAFSMDGVLAVNLLLQVDHPVGSPVVDGGNVLLTLRLFAMHPVFFPQLRDPDYDFVVDQATVLVSPVQFPSNIDPVEALFICDLEENAPTVREVEEALAWLGSSRLLRKVPADVCQGDAWLQDQFQAGVCSDSRGRSLKVVVHLPRLRRETSDIDAPNLARFVEQYFPSREIGLIDDFWQRTVEVDTVDQGVVRIDFRDTMAVSMAFRLVDFFWEWCLGVRRAVRPKLDPLQTPSEMSARIQASGLLLAHVMQAVQTSGLSAAEKQKLQERIGVLGEMFRAIVDRFPTLGFSQVRCRIRRRTGSSLLDATLSSANLDTFHKKLSLLQDSVNYGGNIEVVPSRGAEPRRLVIGHSADRPMDPQLRTFLGLQASAQDLIEVDTAWLKVGHVDELFTFVPSSTSPKGWACLRNSSLLGVQLLLEAARFHLGKPSLSLDQTNWETINPEIHMGDATQPKFVSMLLRGQYWEFRFDRTNSPFPQMHPPKTHDVLRGAVPMDKPFWEEEAAFKVDEFLHLEQRTKAQREVESQKLKPLQAQLTRELGVPVHAIPTLFDLPDGSGLETLLPNMVNMQVLGKSVLVPRPFGPRMQPADAVAVVRKVLGSDPAAKLVSWALIRNLGLDRPQLNIRNHPLSDYAPMRVGGVANSFPDTAPDPEAAFLQHNRTAFGASGELKAGWQRLVVPETTVDLFELTTAAILAAGGARPRFVDTWYYHTRHGGLHCGTNTLRRVR